jgi:hypothetical protein
MVSFEEMIRQAEGRSLILNLVTKFHKIVLEVSGGKIDMDKLQE